MTPEERTYWTIEAMSKFGGSFVQALAECARRADDDNLRKIKDAWQLYWEQYDTIGWRMWKDAEKDQEKLTDARHDR